MGKSKKDDSDDMAYFHAASVMTAKHHILFDTKKQLWHFEDKEKCYLQCDEYDLLLFCKKMNPGIKFNPTGKKAKQQFIDECKVLGRDVNPADLPIHLVQFGQYFYDLNTGKKTAANHTFFSKNKIALEPIIDESRKSKVVDLIDDWTGNKEDTEILIDLMACILIRKNFIAAIVWFVGIGANGKSTAIKLLERLFLPKSENFAAVSLKRLAGDGSFDLNPVFGKLLAVSSEGDGTILKKTDAMKKIASGDSIDREAKYEEADTQRAYCKIFVAANDLPVCLDHTDGWYRRQYVFHFGKTFPDGNDPVEALTDDDVQLFLGILFARAMRIFKSRKLQYDLTLEEKKQRYIRTSNPFIVFWDEYLEVTQNTSEYLLSKDILRVFNMYHEKYSKRKGRYDFKALAGFMRDHGLESEDIKISATSNFVSKGYKGLKWKKSLDEKGSENEKSSRRDEVQEKSPENAKNGAKTTSATATDNLPPTIKKEVGGSFNILQNDLVKNNNIVVCGTKKQEELPLLLAETSHVGGNHKVAVAGDESQKRELVEYCCVGRTRKQIIDKARSLNLNIDVDKNITHGILREAKPNFIVIHGSSPLMTAPIDLAGRLEIDTI